jgi:hypothetical protein
LASAEAVVCSDTWTGSLTVHGVVVVSIVASRVPFAGRGWIGMPGDHRPRLGRVAVGHGQGTRRRARVTEGRTGGIERLRQDVVVVVEAAASAVELAAVPGHEIVLATRIDRQRWRAVIDVHRLGDQMDDRHVARVGLGLVVAARFHDPTRQDVRFREDQVAGRAALPGDQKIVFERDDGRVAVPAINDLTGARIDIGAGTDQQPPRGHDFGHARIGRRRPHHGGDDVAVTAVSQGIGDVLPGHQEVAPRVGRRRGLELVVYGSTDLKGARL